MKKVFLILILFLSCYFIYNKTVDGKFYYLAIGDSLARGTNEYGVASYGYNDHIKDYLYKEQKLKEYNKVFTNDDYRITDILKILEYNEKKDGYSLNRLVKQADILTISLGMNEIYYKLERNNQNIYTYIDNMINNYSALMSYINKFHHEYVFVLGYYNTLGENQDIFNYANYKLKELCDDYDITYIDLSALLDNNPLYLIQKQTFLPNAKGYEKISQIIVEKMENNWYNIACILLLWLWSWRKERQNES